MLKTSPKTVIFALLLSWLCQQGTYATSRVANRIINGHLTTIATAPFVVNLQYNGDLFCGGSLISPSHVLTAAHCVKGKIRNRITVHAGTTDWFEDGIVRTISVAWLPEVFTMQNKLKDAAILKLSTPYNESNVQTIGLCNTQLRPGNVLQVYGWGTIDENSRIPSRYLRTVRVPVIAKTRCMRQYRNILQLSGSMFCAAVPGRRDSCLGDSGGPAIFNGRVCGIVSFGVGCARQRYPGVYTSVPVVRSFINKAMLL